MNNLKYFKYDHLPEHLQEVSKLFHELASVMDVNIAQNNQKDLGFQKLIEAKDCFVRANL